MVQYRELQAHLKDPAIQTRWIVIMPDQERPFQCIAESVEAVQRGVGSKARQSQARVKYYPDNSDIDTLNIVFYETFDFDVTKYLQKWRKLVRDDDGNFGYPKDYEKTIYVQLLKMNSDKVELTFEYQKCWPTEPAPLALSYEDPNGRIQINSVFRVDDVKVY